MRQHLSRTAKVAPRPSNRITAATLISAIVLATSGASAVSAQTPGTSNGSASAFPAVVAGPLGCSQSYALQAAGSATCTWSSANSSATTTTTSTNATRTASSQSSTNMSGGSGAPLAQSTSTQFSQFTVSGTAGAPTALVYHFVTNTGTSVIGGTQTNTFASWQLFFASQQGTTSYGAASGEQDWNDASAVDVIPYGHVTQTGTGYDFTAPFNASAGPVLFDFTTTTGTEAYNETSASTWVSLIAMLSSVDAVNANGQTVGTATFGADGNGTIVLGSTSTVPEPGSLALMATGLVGLAPVVRRRVRVLPRA